MADSLAPPPLSPELATRVLRHLGWIEGPPPTLATLQGLVSRYTRTVPWESASRIARRARHEQRADWALFGGDFWESQFASGTGGTCYESNYAFIGLLRRLGYEAYLTVCDIGGSPGCHSAIVVLLDSRKYLVDVGFPLYAVMPIQADSESGADGPIMRHRLLPQGGQRYLAQRENGARVHAFVLRDEPVAAADYRAIAIHDYRHDGGQFLDAIVIQKIVAGRLWRFHSDVTPFVLQQFVDGERIDHALGADAAAELAAKFGIAREVLAEALAALGMEAASGE